MTKTQTAQAVCTQLLETKRYVLLRTLRKHTKRPDQMMVAVRKATGYNIRYKEVMVSGKKEGAYHIDRKNTHKPKPAQAKKQNPAVLAGEHQCNEPVVVVAFSAAPPKKRNFLQRIRDFFRYLG